jgi:hypothetical protein
LWIVLGFLISMLAHAWIEMWYIDRLLLQGIAPVNYGVFGHYCALPAWLQYGLALAGVFGGFFAGRHFYYVVYVDKRKWKWDQVC